MNATELLAMYERVADAPDAVAKLRRFVLDLAVRGRLHASGLQGWRRFTLGDLGAWGSGGTPLKGHPEYYGGGIPWLVIGDLNDSIVDRSAATLTEEGLLNSSAKLIEPGALLIAMYGSIGKLGITGFRCATNQAIAHCVPDATRVSVEFLFLLVKSLRTQLLSEGQGVAQQNISQRILKAVEVLTPPLAEQHRIVAKVEELMSLCDQLEATRTERESARDRLAAASLARLNAPAPDTFQSDARFALSVLPALSARPDQVKQLRQTILNLAVRGKLVPQIASDEPALALLERISAAKAELGLATRDARIRQAPTPEVPEHLTLFPPTWAVQSFENLFLFIDYRGGTPTKTRAGVPLITAKNVRMGFLASEPREYVSDDTCESWMTRGLPRFGDLFFTTEAPLGNVCVNEIEPPFALAQRVICLQPFGSLNTRFIMYAVMSELVQGWIEAKASGMTAKGIKAANLKPIALPIPPLAEQHRIVAKVDSLLALCDQLELSMIAGDGTRGRLLDVVLHEALTAPVDEALLTS
jgi:type I restriction enzyme S subunit